MGLPRSKRLPQVYRHPFYEKNLGELVGRIIRRHNAWRMVLTWPFEIGRPLPERLGSSVLPVDSDRAFQNVPDASKLMDVRRDLSVGLHCGDAHSQRVFSGLNLPQSGLHDNVASKRRNVFRSCRKNTETLNN
jgi:hypothetical protein